MSLAVHDLSLFAHLIQTLGIFLICLLFGGLFGVSPRRYFLYWVKAWCVLFLAMVCLQIFFRYSSYLSWIQYFYFVGGYCFAFYLWAGLYCFPRRRLPNGLAGAPVFLLILGWSLALMLMSETFLDRFTLHAFVFALSLLPSIIMVFRLKFISEQSWVKFFSLVSLCVLVFIFMGNAFDLFSEKRIGQQANAIYVAYQSVFDVLVELSLAFGLIMIVATNVQAKLKLHQKLVEKDRDTLALLAHKDPLTDCFNRHALNKMISSVDKESGLLIMIDINNLKIINDKFGHPVGDKVIQQVAITLKEFSRADDFIFRVGGDEFLLIALGLNMRAGEERMQNVKHKLAEHKIESSAHAITISWGVEEFRPDLKIEEVMFSADKKLYLHKADFKTIS